MLSPPLNQQEPTSQKRELNEDVPSESFILTKDQKRHSIELYQSIYQHMYGNSNVQYATQSKICSLPLSVFVKESLLVLQGFPMFLYYHDDESYQYIHNIENDEIPFSISGYTTQSILSVMNRIITISNTIFVFQKQLEELSNQCQQYLQHSTLYSYRIMTFYLSFLNAHFYSFMESLNKEEFIQQIESLTSFHMVLNSIQEQLSTLLYLYLCCSLHSTTISYFSYTPSVLIEEYPKIASQLYLQPIHILFDNLLLLIHISTQNTSFYTSIYHHLIHEYIQYIIYCLSFNSNHFYDSCDLFVQLNPIDVHSLHFSLNPYKKPTEIPDQYTMQDLFIDCDPYYFPNCFSFLMIYKCTRVNKYIYLLRYYNSIEGNVVFDEQYEPIEEEDEYLNIYDSINVYVDQICNVYITNGYLMNRTLSNKQQDGSYPTIWRIISIRSITICLWPIIIKFWTF